MSAQGVYPDSNEFNGEDMQPELGDSHYDAYKGDMSDFQNNDELDEETTGYGNDNALKGRSEEERAEMLRQQPVYSEEAEMGDDTESFANEVSDFYDIGKQYYEKGNFEKAERYRQSAIRKGAFIGMYEVDFQPYGPDEDDTAEYDEFY